MKKPNELLVAVAWLKQKEFAHLIACIDEIKAAYRSLPKLLSLIGNTIIDKNNHLTEVKKSYENNAMMGVFIYKIALDFLSSDDIYQYYTKASGDLKSIISFYILYNPHRFSTFAPIQQDTPCPAEWPSLLKDTHFATQAVVNQLYGIGWIATKENPDLLIEFDKHQNTMMQAICLYKTAFDFLGPQVIWDIYLRISKEPVDCSTNSIPLSLPNGCAIYRDNLQGLLSLYIFSNYQLFYQLSEIIQFRVSAWEGIYSLIQKVEVHGNPKLSRSLCHSFMAMLKSNLIPYTADTTASQLQQQSSKALAQGKGGDNFHKLKDKMLNLSPINSEDMQCIVIMSDMLDLLYAIGTEIINKDENLLRQYHKIPSEKISDGSHEGKDPIQALFIFKIALDSQSRETICLLYDKTRRWRNSRCDIGFSTFLPNGSIIADDGVCCLFASYILNHYEDYLSSISDFLDLLYQEDFRLLAFLGSRDNSTFPSLLNQYKEVMTSPSFTVKQRELVRLAELILEKKNLSSPEVQSSLRFFKTTRVNLYRLLEVIGNQIIEKNDHLRIEFKKYDENPRMKPVFVYKIALDFLNSNDIYQIYQRLVPGDLKSIISFYLAYNVPRFSTFPRNQAYLMSLSSPEASRTQYLGQCESFDALIKDTNLTANCVAPSPELGTTDFDCLIGSIYEKKIFDVDLTTIIFVKLLYEIGVQIIHKNPNLSTEFRTHQNPLLQAIWLYKQVFDFLSPQDLYDIYQKIPKTPQAIVPLPNGSRLNLKVLLSFYIFTNYQLFYQLPEISNFTVYQWNGLKEWLEGAAKPDDLESNRSLCHSFVAMTKTKTTRSSVTGQSLFISPRLEPQDLIPLPPVNYEEASFRELKNKMLGRSPINSEDIQCIETKRELLLLLYGIGAEIISTNTQLNSQYHAIPNQVIGGEYKGNNPMQALFICKAALDYQSRETICLLYETRKKWVGRTLDHIFSGSLPNESTIGLDGACCLIASYILNHYEDFQNFSSIPDFIDLLTTESNQIGAFVGFDERSSILLYKYKEIVASPSALRAAELRQEPHLEPQIKFG